MIVHLPCGHTIDDAVSSTVCDGGRHYPIGSGPSSYCPRCDLYKPCLCDREIADALTKGLVR